MIKNSSQIYKNALLIGGSGKLGSEIVKSKYFKNINAPEKKFLNLKNKKQIKKYLSRDINLIINCSGYTEIRKCEKFKKKAFDLNVVTTRNLVREIIYQNKMKVRKIKLIQISSDAVYAMTNGNYRENGRCNPKSYYGLCKLETEKAVKKINNFLIIRTRFFNKKNFQYNDAATDIYSSMIELNNLIKYIDLLIKKKIKGIINIGQRRNSDYNILKKYFKKIKKISRLSIQEKTNTFITKDASMNIKKFLKILKKNG
jgi:dTDP-4-dehydrorhamnose reductase|tara:strand:- start:383 stop:1153 length:771 start_codon:yes stop_codon:yes gene_type:complete